MFTELGSAMCSCVHVMIICKCVFKEMCAELSLRSSTDGLMGTGFGQIKANWLAIYLQTCMLCGAGEGIISPTPQVKFQVRCCNVIQ